MNDIKTIDPQEVLDASPSQLFVVVWSNSQGTFFGIGGGSFQSALHGGGKGPLVVDRGSAVREYYALVSAAKASQIMTDGRIDLIELPVFEK